jgi:hypothetical protein
MKKINKHKLILPLLLPLFLLSCGQEEKKVTEDKTVKAEAPKEVPLIVPPFETVDVPFETFVVDADSGKVFYSANGYGTSVSVPGGIFIDSAGNKITGKITMKYRELNTVNDFLASGIPMNYDAAGMLRRFNTAGMFELRATQNNHGVFLDSGKVISVNMASFEAGSAYHAFHLDEKVARDWEYIRDLEGKDNEEKKKIIRNAKAKVNELQVPLSGEYFAFNYMALLDVYLNDKVVEIKKMRSDLTLQGKIKEYGATWTNIYCYQSVEYQGQKTLASLLLWKKLNKEPWPVWMNSANCNLIDNKNGTYNIELSQTKGKGVYKGVIEPHYSIKALLAQTPAYWKGRYNQAVRKAIADEMSRHRMADVFRAMEVHRFGVYCASKLQRQEDEIVVGLEPDFKSTEKIDAVYYVSEAYHTVLRFPQEEWDRMVIMPDPKAKVFAILRGEGIALVQPDDMKNLDFKALRAKPGTVIGLTFKKIEGAIGNLTEVAKILGISQEPI